MTRPSQPLDNGPHRTVATVAAGSFDDPAGHWNRRYEAPGLLFGAAPNATLAAHERLFGPGDHVLCVADGEGRNSTWLAARGCRVTAFDVSGVALDKARRLAGERGVEVDYRLASLDDWVWAPDAFDAVVAVFVQFAAPAQRAAMFRGFARTLRLRGLLLLVGYGPRQLQYRTGGPGKLEHLYTEEMLRDAFAGWSIERLVREDRVLHEGAGHDGQSDVLEMVARRDRDDRGQPAAPPAENP
jgi:SAM-dependent methyltransferase